jgi:large subunit ribosomal protein L34e
MVRRSLRTRSTKKVKVRTPGGRTVTHYRAEKAQRSTCGRCGTHLSGMATGTSTEVSSKSASSKAPARPYAGVLCSDCLDTLIRYVTRQEVKNRSAENADIKIQRDLTLEKFLPRGWWSQVSKGTVLWKVPKEKPSRKAKPAPKASEKPKAKPKAKKAK